MVECGNAYPRNEDRYLASPFFYKNLQTLTHPTSFTHKTTTFKITLFLSMMTFNCSIFLFKRDDLYNENEGLYIYIYKLIN